jgi:hypothetical protein
LPEASSLGGSDLLLAGPIMTEIQYEVREKDLIAFNEHLLENSERIQTTIRRHQAIIPAVIAVIALILFFYFKDIPSSIYALMLAMAWGLGVPFFLKWSMRKQLRQVYTEKEKAQIFGHRTLQIEAHDLVVTGSEGVPEGLPWKKVLRIEVEKKYAFIFVTLNSALIIPRETLKSGDLHQFLKEADERIEKAG